MKIPKSAILMVFVAVFGMALWLVPTIAQAAVTWTRVNTAGFGDAKNNIIYALAPYNGKFYTGTSNSVTGTEVWSYDGTTWTQVNTDGFGDSHNSEGAALVSFGGKLYVATTNYVTGSEVWSYDGTTWTQVNTDGFGNANNILSYSMIVWQGKLYLSTTGGAAGCGIRSYDGTTWTQVNTDGFGDVSNYFCMSLTEYQNKLYAGTYKIFDGGELWSYDGSTWSQAGTDGFGDATNVGFMSLKVYNGKLYIGTQNMTNGTDVWQFDGTTATRVATAGFGDGRNIGCFTLAVYKGSLYCGTTNSASWTEVWRYDGINWTQANADGFYSASNNLSTPLLLLRGNTLFAGTANFVNGTELWAGTMPVNSLGIVTAPAANGRANIRVLDSAGKQLSSFFAYGTNQKMGVRVIQADIDGDQVNEIVTVPGAGVEARVKAFELNGHLIASVLPYSGTFKGGASLTAGDFNGDGRDEIAVAPLKGGGPKVRVYALNSAGNAFTLLNGFDAYPASFKGGINLSTGDVTGYDGQDELIVAPYGDGRPNLRVYGFNTTTNKFSLVDWIYVYPQSFRDGVQVATGDINGDLQDEIIVLPQKNGRANLRVYTINSSSKLQLLTSVLGYSNSYKGTVSLATGDVDGNGSDEIILAPKTNGRPKVAIFHYHDSKLSQLLTWSAYSDSFRGGVNLQVSDLDNDGQAEVVTVPATGAKATIKVWDIDGSTARLTKSVLGYSGSFLGGVNLGQ